MLAEGLQAYLADNPTLQSMLGTPATRGDSQTGIFPTLAPSASTMPYIVFSQIAGAPTTTSMQGSNALQTERWRFSCYGTTYKRAKKLAKMLKLAMVSMDGTLSQGACEVHGAWHILELDDVEGTPHATLWATHQDFEITYLDYDT
jgi:hypothetical protein